jgi:phenylpropionate dioxygenase-like ring-hydroxylating dioxygenase large terminal subunit
MSNPPGVLGSLKEHWYPVARSARLKAGQSLGVQVWGTPIALWRSREGVPAAFVDRCPHRGAALSGGYVDGETLLCGYHGWRFGANGNCLEIPTEKPESSKACARTVETFRVFEQDELVWVWFGNPATEGPKPTPVASLCGPGFSFWHTDRIFRSAVLDVVENFLDSSHTSFVHNGLIRRKSERVRRSITIQCDGTAITAAHEPSMEKVGPFHRLINPKLEPITHSDQFQLPATIRVDYAFGNSGRRFCSLIRCTPITAQSTHVFLSTGVCFGWLNPPVRWALPLLGRRVLQQDEAILENVAANRQRFDQEALGFVAADLMLVKVRAMWHAAKAGEPVPAFPPRSVEVYL